MRLKRSSIWRPTLRFSNDLQGQRRMERAVEWGWASKDSGEWNGLWSGDEQARTAENGTGCGVGMSKQGQRRMERAVEWGWASNKGVRLKLGVWKSAPRRKDTRFWFPKLLEMLSTTSKVAEVQQLSENENRECEICSRFAVPSTKNKYHR